jgi:hypothetical protein
MAVDGYETANSSYQHFSSTGTYTVIFSRPITNMVITFTGTNNMSFDGTNFMSMTAGTYQFTHLGLVKYLYFTGGGTRAGCGIAL